MKKYFPYSLILILILLDQLIKVIILKYSSWAIINPNYIFGFGVNGGLFFLLAAILILILGIIKLEKTANIYPFGLMLGGALSNLIDRLFRGGVIDYFNIGLIKFNLADIFLIAGVILYVWILPRQTQN